MSVESRIAKGEVKVNGRSVGDIDYNQKQELIVTILFRYLADLTNPNIKNGLLSYMEDKSQVKRLEKVNKSAANLAEAFNIKELSLALAELVMKNSTILHSDLKLIRWKMEHTLNDDHLTIEGLLKKFPQLVDPYELYDLFLSWNGKVDRDSSVAPIKKMQAVTAKKYLDDFLDIGFVKSKLEDFFYGALQPHYNYGNQHTSGFTIDREYLKQAMTVSYNTIIDEAKRSYNYEYATIIGFIENNPNNKNIKRLVSLKKEYDEAFQLAHELWMLNEFSKKYLKSDHVMNAGHHSAAMTSRLYSNDVTYQNIYKEFREDIEELVKKKTEELVKTLGKLQKEYYGLKTSMEKNKKSQDEPQLGESFTTRRPKNIEVPELYDENEGLREKYYQQYMEAKVEGKEMSFVEFLEELCKKDREKALSRPVTDSEANAYEYAVSRKTFGGKLIDFILDNRLNHDLLRLLEFERKREAFAKTVYAEYIVYLASERNKNKAKSFAEFVEEKYKIANVDVPIEKEEEYKELKGLK